MEVQSPRNCASSEDGIAAPSSIAGFRRGSINSLATASYSQRADGPTADEMSLQVWLLQRLPRIRGEYRYYTVRLMA